jgi:hypothetical protein
MRGTGATPPLEPPGLECELLRLVVFDAVGPVVADAVDPVVADFAAVDDADVADVAFDVVGVVAALEETCFEPPQAARTIAAAPIVRKCGQSLTFGA